MPKDTYWFKHDSNARADLKIKALISKYGWQGYGWFWFVIELLRSEDTYKLSYNEDIFEAMSIDMGIPSNEAKEYIDYLIKKRLLSINGAKQFTSDRLLRDMAVKDQIREHAREAANQRWTKAKEPDQALADESPTHDLDWDIYLDEMRTKYPALDVTDEWERCQLWWLENKKTMKSPKLALRNWLDKAKSSAANTRQSKKHDPLVTVLTDETKTPLF